MKSPHNKLTKEIFIERATIIHNGKYDYSLLCYVDAHTKVQIICPIHGSYRQVAYSHLLGNSCPSCGKTKKRTQEDFIVKAESMHGSYDFSQAVYVNNRTKVKVICNQHGSFFMAPHDLFGGRGCPKCGRTRGVLKITKTIQEFLEEASCVHGDKYQYLTENFKNRQSEITIVCKIHGHFLQKAEVHLHGSGCGKCAENIAPTNIEFTERAKLVHHNKYSYELCTYTTSKTKVKITCPKHGVFEQLPTHHVNGHGCSKCSSRMSNMEVKWLDGINIPNEYRQKMLRLNNKIINVDAFDPNTNTIYEFYGDFWHGNPVKYAAHEINLCNKQSFGDLFAKTVNRERFLKQLGFDVISVWESDFQKQ